MSYQAGTATNMADLISQLFTFATGTPGWTQDQLATGSGQAALHKGNCYVSFRWNTTTPLPLGIYQALGYTGGNQPGAHPNDSGNGAVSSTNSVLTTERCVNDLGNGAFPSYFFFTDAAQTYIHVVVEITTNVFRHFGFGNITKVGDWTGGEYCYGDYWASQDPQTNSNSSLLDGLFGDSSNRERAATIHVEGLTGQSGASKWGEVSGINSAPSTDTAGNSRILVNGGYRSGPIASNFGSFAAGVTSGLIPMYPIGLFYRRISTTDAYFLGFMPDVRGVNIGFINPKDEITIGSDVWKFFPLAQKTTANVTNRTYNSGIAYKKVP